MAYNNFTVNQLQKEFGLVITRQPDLFAAVSPSPMSDLLRQILARNRDMAPRSGSEMRVPSGTDAVIDSDIYYFDNVEKIVGIILSMLR